MSIDAKLAVPAIFALALASGSAFADPGTVKIDSVSPDMPYASDKITLKYEATAGTEGDHLHLNVDGKRVDVIRQMMGTTELGPLPSGTHHVCLAVNTKAHVPTGAESCQDIKVW